MKSVLDSMQKESSGFENINTHMVEMNNLVKVTTDAAINSSATDEEVLAVIDQIVMVFEDISTVTDALNQEMKRYTFRNK
jgi:hypothetical protein